MIKITYILYTIADKWREDPFSEQLAQKLKDLCVHSKDSDSESGSEEELMKDILNDNDDDDINDDEEEEEEEDEERTFHNNPFALLNEED